MPHDVQSHSVLTEFGLGYSWQQLDEHSKPDGSCNRKQTHHCAFLYAYLLTSSILV